MLVFFLSCNVLFIIICGSINEDTSVAKAVFSGGVDQRDISIISFTDFNRHRR